MRVSIFQSDIAGRDIFAPLQDQVTPEQSAQFCPHVVKVV